MFLFSSQLFLPDLFIACLLAVGVSVTIICIHFLYKKNIHRITRVFIAIFGLFTVFCTLTLLYATFIEPQLLTINEQIIYTKKDIQLRIAVISDMHIRPGKSERFLERLVQKTNAQQPDVILLAGDFVFDWRSDISPLEVLAGFESTYGTFAVLGNHDQGQYLKMNGDRVSMDDATSSIVEVLQTAGITMLRNTSTNIALKSQTITLVGIDDWWAEPNLTAALVGVDTSNYTILLSHNPSVVQSAEAKAANLVISGHTHAGQVRLPWYGSIKRLPTSLGKQYDQGLFTIHNQQLLAITRGVGESLLRVRFLAPPEIMILTLQ